MRRHGNVNLSTQTYSPPNNLTQKSAQTATISLLPLLGINCWQFFHIIPYILPKFANTSIELYLPYLQHGHAELLYLPLTHTSYLLHYLGL